MIERNLNKNNLLYIISLLFAIKESKAEFYTNDFLSKKNEGNHSKRQFFPPFAIPPPTNYANNNPINNNPQNTNTNNNNNKVGNLNNGNNKNVNNNNNNNNNGGMIQNLDCRYVSILLNDFGLDYGWKQNNDCCMYNRITCMDKSGQKTTKTTENTIITKIFFNNIKVNGVIPTSLCSLTNLKVLQFVNNEGLNGPIPNCIGALNNLEKLVFSNTSITGDIPKSLVALTNLQYLSIEKTNVQNNIPEEITNLKNLIKLYINNNPYLTGSIPQSIDNLSNLEMLSFSDTHINGTIPEKLGNIKTLKSLSLHHTFVEGKIPDSIGELTNLETIKFHNTKLSGEIPISFNNLKNLKIFTLNSTSLEGPLPDGITTNQFGECAFGDSNICLNNEATKNEQGIANCVTSLPVCTLDSMGALSENKGNGISVLKYTGIFLIVVTVLVTIGYFYRRYQLKKFHNQEKRAINYYKNNITDQPKWMGSSVFSKPVHSENIQAYNVNVEQHVDPSVYRGNTSIINRFFESFKSLKNNYRQLNESQYENLNSNNMYIIHSDSVFQYNTMGMDDKKQQIKQINDDSLRNNDETFVNNNEKLKIKNEFGDLEVINKSVSQKSLDSEKTEYENPNNKVYEAMSNIHIPYNDSMYKNTNSTGSSIPLPPNTENMVFMGREAQEELKLFQQNNNFNNNNYNYNNYNNNNNNFTNNNYNVPDDARSVKEQLEELEQMASNNYASYGNKSPKPFKSPKSPKSPKPNKSPKSPSNKSTPNLVDENNKSADINDQVLELKYSSFNGLDLNSENFHNSKTFDKIEKKFLNHLDSLRTTTITDNATTENKDTTVDDSKNNEAKFFANIPGLQIQEYYNQLNLSMDDSNNSNWTKNKEGEEDQKKFDKIIPSGIFTTNKTSWDTDEDSFFSNESSFRNTKNQRKTNDYNTSSINTTSLSKEIKSKLGTDSMMMEGEKYRSMASTDYDSSRYKSGVTEDSRYRSGLTSEGDYSRYTEDDSRYRDSRYKSGLTSESGYSRYTSGVTDDSRYRDSRYKSGLTSEGDYSRYTSGVTDDSRYRDSRYKSGYTEDTQYTNERNRPSTFGNFNSTYSSYTNVVITGPDSSDENTTDTLSKDYSAGYSSGGYTLSNANTLSSGFTLNSSVKTISNGSSLAPRTNSTRTTKTSSNLNQVSTISGGTDSLFSDLSKLSSLNSMDSVSSLSSFTDTDSE